MHVLFICDGLPEGIEKFKSELDRHNFGNGGSPCRLREIKLFDLQFDSKDKRDVMALLNNSIKERKHEEMLSYKLEQEENPFKQGMFNRLLCFFVRYFGWVIGAEPWESWKEKDLPKPQLGKWLLNILPVAMIRDNFVYNKVHKTIEEWL